MRNLYIVNLICLLILCGCSDFLDIPSKGVLSEDQIDSPDDIDGYVTAAYSYIPSLGFAESLNPWMHGSIRSDDAYKGGGGLGDQYPWAEMEIFSTVTAHVGNNDGVWFHAYQGISRCNTALRLLDKVTEEEYPKKSERIGEVKFLRAWIYYRIKLLWKYVPIIDEKIELTAAAHELVPNRVKEEGNDLYLWDFILNDFKDAAETLPEKQERELGRVDQYAAKAMAARTLLFMAYEQDDKHQVININKSRLEEALSYIEDIEKRDKEYFDLCDDFADNFLPEYDNNTKESLFETQYSINDGTIDGRVNWGDQLNYPWWTPHFNCCDFHKVSYNLANAFRTDENGLPLFDTFNNLELKGNKDAYFSDNTFDVRFSHTVAVPGYPFKYDQTLLFDSTASRDPVIYGYLKSMKELVHPDCDCLFKPFFVQSSMNKKNIRYSEVLLWKAEILIKLGRHKEALPIINRIRKRAAQSTQRLYFEDGSLLLNYHVGLYEDGVNCNWTNEFAFKCLQWENRLELACEGRRFFDLQRWGILQSTMNAYFEKERTRYNWMDNAYFTAGRDEYKPIPQPQINWAKGNYTQNPNY